MPKGGPRPLWESLHFLSQQAQEVHKPDIPTVQSRKLRHRAKEQFYAVVLSFERCRCTEFSLGFPSLRFLRRKGKILSPVLSLCSVLTQSEDSQCAHHCSFLTACLHVASAMHFLRGTRNPNHIPLQNASCHLAYQQGLHRTHGSHVDVTLRTQGKGVK